MLEDWYSKAVATYERVARRFPADTAFSSKVPRLSGHPAQDLPRIRESVRGVVRAHGVPRNCRIDFASLGQKGAGCAGFDDAPHSFEQPFIHLEKSVYESIGSADVLDVYRGLGLHEAGHILHTRDGFLRLARGMSRLRSIYENLWEDERVEELVRSASPGFAGYIQAAKRVLLEQGEPGRAVEGWKQLVDIDVINAVIFAFVRFPHRIPLELRMWTAVNGECVFEALRSCFPHGPVTEQDVAELAERLERLWRRFRQLYPGTVDDARQLLRGEARSLDEVRRIAEQLAADLEDRARHGTDADRCPPSHGPDSRLSSQEVASNLLDAAVQVEDLARSQPEESTRRLWRDLADRLLQKAIDSESAPATAHDHAGCRFGLSDLARVHDHLTTVRVPLSNEEMAALAVSSSEAACRTERWESDSTRATIVRRATGIEADARLRYEEALQQVRSQIQALRATFAFRRLERSTVERDLRHGRLDFRKLAGAVIGGSPRIYKRRVISPVRGVAICLLLDESGSMSGLKAEATMRVAVLLAESLRGIAGVELEVYSHTSSEEDDAACLIRHLAGKGVPDHRAIGSYAGQQMGYNYDHQAILTVARLFREATKSPHRWLIVISDGQPSGQHYGGTPAIAATRDAVASVRRRGIKVINIAIDDFCSEELFGKSWVLRFTDLSALVENMRRLVVQLASGG